jgi:hypothetical protein
MNPNGSGRPPLKKSLALVALCAPLLVLRAAPAAAQTVEGGAADGSSAPPPARPKQGGGETAQPKRLAWGGPMSQIVYLDAQTGVEFVQLRTFLADFNNVSAGFLPTSGAGPTARIGAGFRLGFLTLGLRGRVASFDEGGTVGSWQIWTLDAELGVRVPLRRVEPHVAFAVGYSSFGGLGTAIGGLQDGLDVHGADGRLTMGVDYWVTHNLSLGIDLGGELLFIARPGVSVRDLATPKQIGTVNDAEARVLEASGTSAGAALSLTGGAGLHF